MATNATELSVSKLADVVKAITEVTEPYQLGIQLKVDTSILKRIENDHPGKTDRQKTEIIEHWLRDSLEASWTTLANAVEGMGGHARLAERLRSKGKKSEKPSSTVQVEVQSDEKQPSKSNAREVSHETSVYEHEYQVSSRSASLNTLVRRQILLLGIAGHGKSTLGNKILSSDSRFKINDQSHPRICKGKSYLNSATHHKSYKIKVFDHTGLFEDPTSIDILSSTVPSQLDLVIFVLKRRCSFNESEVEKLKFVISKWDIGHISALVLTHCEDFSEEERGVMIEQFKKDCPSVAELMGKGILAVGFPDSSHVIEISTELKDRVQDDKAKLRRLIYSCDDSRPVRIPQPSQSRRHCCCSIL